MHLSQHSGTLQHFSGQKSLKATLGFCFLGFFWKHHSKNIKIIKRNSTHKTFCLIIVFFITPPTPATRKSLDPIFILHFSKFSLSLSFSSLLSSPPHPSPSLLNLSPFLDIIPPLPLLLPPVMRTQVRSGSSVVGQVVKRGAREAPSGPVSPPS